MAADGVTNLNAIIESTADYIGDLYEITDALAASINGDTSTPVATSFFSGSGNVEALSPIPAIAFERHNNVTSFYRLIRDFVSRVKPWSTNAIWYFTKPDERFDLTLVSRRVYGYPDEFLAVMAAADMDSVENELHQKQIVLPSLGLLAEIKRKAGFQNLDDVRSL